MMLIPTFLSFFISVITAIVVQRLFFRYNKIDPINHRSSHTATATRTGGISIFAALFSTSLYLYFTDQELFDFSLLVPLSIMFVIGVYDDFYNADFKLKFFIQIIVAKILIDQGLLIDNYHGLFGLYEIPRLLAQLSTVFVFLVIVNAINFIDGIDGLAISEVIKVIFLLEFFSNQSTALFPMAGIIIISMFPLYYFNFKKENKIFLGDGGSLLLGTVVAVYVFYTLGTDYTFKPNLIINKTLFVVMVLLYPLVDLLRVFVLRIKAGQSPFVADKRHIHHVVLRLVVKQHYTTALIIFLELVLVSAVF